MKSAGKKKTLATDLDRSAVPRYVQLASLFRRRIQSGLWAVGGQIPTLEELVDECGVARATIRQALGLLQKEGLIDRMRAKGTFVMRSPQEQLWCEVRTDWSGLLLSREGATIELLSNTRGAMPPRIDNPIGQLCKSYRHLRRRHFRNGQAYLLADTYVDEAVAKKIPEKSLRSLSALKLIADVPGLEIVDARQTLTIGSADIETAQQLNVPLNLPVAFVQRIAVARDKRLVLVSNGVYRGDVVRLDMRLK